MYGVRTPLKNSREATDSCTYLHGVKKLLILQRCFYFCFCGKPFLEHLKCFKSIIYDVPTYDKKLHTDSTSGNRLNCKIPNAFCDNYGKLETKICTIHFT